MTAQADKAKRRQNIAKYNRWLGWISVILVIGAYATDSIRDNNPDAIASWIDITMQSLVGIVPLIHAGLSMFLFGFPRFNPGEFTTTDLLSRGEADAAMIIASDPASNFPKAAIDHMKRIPIISLDTKQTVTSKLAHVAFATSTYGINTTGTVYRMDDVPITLRPAFESPFPSDQEILIGIRKRVHELVKEKRKIQSGAST